MEDVIQLASRIGDFDLASEFGIAPGVVETLDTTYALAIAAGLEALRDAGLASPTKSEGLEAWRLAPEHRDETGVIFAASFPALDSLVGEIARAMSTKLLQACASSRQKLLGDLKNLVARCEIEPEQSEAVAGAPAGECARALGDLGKFLDRASTDAEAELHASGYEFNRKLLFKLLVMANSQLAEIVQAKGPNLHINAACAGTTAAISLAQDWLRTGRCRRVVVISADNPSSEHLLQWVGIGFLALGAASVKSDVCEAALPFDKRRNGMLLGAGAVGLVLETDIAAGTRSHSPLVTLLGVRHANSAFHASAIGTSHACEQLKLLLAEVEQVHGISKAELADSLLYVSHETFTYARNGGCAGAEVTALRKVFGDALLRKILITNTKGMTGHAMGVCFEDVVAVAALSSGRAPPIVNHKEVDQVLGPLRLSEGGNHSAKYALHFSAGFGSQICYVLYKKG